MNSPLKVEPHLVIMGTTSDPEDDDWFDQLDYHIAAADEQSNNVYVGTIISSLIEYRNAHGEMSWKVEYRELKTLQTTNGRTSLPGQRFDVTDINKKGEHEEVFQDRNSDSWCEFNRALPVYEEYPRFLTEYDQAQLNPPAKDEDKGEDKPKAEHAPGEEVEGEDEPDDTLHVSDGDVITVYDELGHAQQMRISVI